LGNIFKDDKKSEDEVLSNCAFLNTYNISIFDMFDFSSRNIEINDIIKFYNLKKNLNAKMEMEKNNESLEEEYIKAKKLFEEMKENRLKSKNQRLPAKFVNSVAQTNDDMKEKDFDDYFV
jgi:replication initiation and membrane attachment protein DnaB